MSMRYLPDFEAAWIDCGAARSSPAQWRVSNVAIRLADAWATDAFSAPIKRCRATADLLLPGRRLRLTGVGRIMASSFNVRPSSRLAASISSAHVYGKRLYAPEQLIENGYRPALSIYGRYELLC